MDNEHPKITGRGRGAIIKQLLEQKQQSAAPATSSATNTTDSGLGLGVPTPTTSSSVLSGGGGGSQRLSVQGRGRVLQQLLDAKKQHASVSTPSTTSSISTESLTQTGLRSGLGRSKIVGMLKAMQFQSHRVVEEPIEPAESAGPVESVAETLTDPAPEPEVVRKRGNKGTPLQITTNYLRLKTDPTKGVFEYEVRYNPNVHAANLRHSLLNQHKTTVIGTTKTFDGVTLYLPILLPDPVTELVSTNPNDNSSVTLQVIYKRKKHLGECVHLYNVLFDRIMKQLNFVRFGRKLFDPTAPSVIPQHKLEVWPGYVTAVDEYEDGVMLCLDVSHRVLCQSTVLDLMRNAYRSDAGNFQTNVMTAMLGKIILTRYNNRSYRVDDVKFDASPMDTFTMNGREVTYVEYYKSQYNITIQDTKQPLLVHTEERAVAGQVEKELIALYLIPEICYLTGLTDTMRADFRVMRDIATITRVTPNQRMASFQQFCKSVNGNAETKAILGGWGLTLETQTLQLQARQLDEEDIQFARRSFKAGPQADFGKYATSNEVLSAINISKWLVLHTRNDSNYARKFVECMNQNSKPMGIQVCKPIIEVLDSDKTDLYVKALRRFINAELQIVVIICPTSRDDRYAAIKKICCAELPIPCQVINGKTLSNDAKNRSIVQKIALQMNCKLGGTLWSVKIPFNNVMICGVDTYHDPAHKADSVVAFVASQNSTYTKWYSQPILQKKKEELSNGLCIALVKSLHAYRTMNLALPEKIIIFRDGVGDGQLRMCNEYEVPQIKASFAAIDPNYNPMLTFIVVQKRINTRLFAMKGPKEFVNPLPGCVLDHTVTRRFMYDYLLVPQSVRQGTVSPTHYIVVHDSANFSPDVLQRLSYKLCFLYYNWPGTVRVPACCQYAHKLAYLVGQSVCRPTAESLSDKLFYL